MLPYLFRCLAGFSFIICFLYVPPCVGTAQVVSSFCKNSTCLYGDDYCNTLNGRCLYGCMPGYVGTTCSAKCAIPECKECIRLDSTREQCTRCHNRNHYGPHCDQRCSPYCHGTNDLCDNFGNCLRGCYDPYIGTKCDKQNCTIPNCDVCGRQGELIVCAQCKPGYGLHQHGCIGCRGHCLRGYEDCLWSDICQSESCLPGWTGQSCNETCEMDSCQNCTRSRGKDRCTTCELGLAPNNDGTNCLVCSKNCIGQCDPSTGACVHGCQPGYYGINNFCDHFCTLPNCSQCQLMPDGSSKCVKCDPRFYNVQGKCYPCSETCKTVGTNVCDPFTGDCLSGCKDGWYGDSCHWRCSQNCVDKTCNSSSGACSCTYGWYGENCDRTCPVHCTDCITNFHNGVCAVCEAGWFGKICDKKCSPNCRNRQYKGYSYCDRDTGRCIDGCISGMYGISCSLECSPNCDSDSCQQDSGLCIGGCTVSWYGNKCDKQCSNNCQITTSGHTRACDMYTGKCHACRPGFFGDFCRSVCSPHCAEVKCEQDSGVCTNGCNQGYSGNKCETLCQGRCPGDCGPNCLYDSCDETTATCRLGCKKGWYGSFCLEMCNLHCLDLTCHSETGNCTTGCVLGMYGGHCNRTCGKHCVDHICDQGTGYCRKGCAPGFYGDQCIESCPAACYSVTCHRVTGACDRCGIGRTGDRCDQDCYPGYYGENCETVCGHCHNGGQCYSDDGRCPMGCEQGWTGSTCTKGYVIGSDVNEELDTGLKAAIGCSVVGVVCCLAIIGGVCWWKRRTKQSKKKSVEELHVTYRDSQATIETLHESNGSVTGSLLGAQSQSRCENQESDGDYCSSTSILGDSTGDFQIQVGKNIWEGPVYSLHKGTVIRRHQQRAKCCMKLVQLKRDQDVKDQAYVLNRLLQETEILRLCGHHNNIIDMITMYHSKDVFCVAMDTSLETGLLPYLHGIQTSSGVNVLEPAAVDQLLQFSIDVCMGVLHIHQLKVIHRALRAGHVCVSSAQVAKIGYFDWAERVGANDATAVSNDLPPHFFQWLAPESLLRNDFSYRSDMWSLGMLIWEIFSLGRAPYHDMSQDDQRQKVLDGVRPPKPQSANFTVYRLMKGCWRYDPSDRLSPEHLLHQLQAIQMSGKVSETSGNEDPNQGPHQQLDTAQILNSSEIAQSYPNISGVNHNLGNSDGASAMSGMNIKNYQHKVLPSRVGYMPSSGHIHSEHDMTPSGNIHKTDISPSSHNMPPMTNAAPRMETSAYQSLGSQADSPTSSDVVMPRRNPPLHQDLRSPDSMRPTSHTRRALNFNPAAHLNVPSSRDTLDHQHDRERSNLVELALTDQQTSDHVHDEVFC